MRHTSFLQAIARIRDNNPYNTIVMIGKYCARASSSPSQAGCQAVLCIGSSTLP